MHNRKLQKRKRPLREQSLKRKGNDQVSDPDDQ